MAGDDTGAMAAAPAFPTRGASALDLPHFGRIIGAPLDPHRLPHIAILVTFYMKEHMALTRCGRLAIMGANRRANGVAPASPQKGERGNQLQGVNLAEASREIFPPEPVS